MKTILVFLLLVLSIFTNTNLLHGQWTQTSALVGCNISSFFVSGNKLFALTWDGVYLSTNNGSSWSGINNGLTTTGGISSFTAVGQNLFVTTSVGGFFHSTNNGASWNKFISSVSGAPIWYFAACDTNLFAGTYGGGVFLSTDDGVTWTAVNNGLNDLYILSLFAEGTNLFAWNSAGVFLSTNNGTSWSPVAPPDMGISSIAVSDTNIFTAIKIHANSGIYRSTDRGKNWFPLNDKLPNRNLPIEIMGNRPFTALAVSGSHIFVGTSDNIDGGVFHSTDNGTSWTAIDSGLTNHLVSALAVTDSTLFAGTMSGGAYFSRNYGTSWAEANNGLTGTWSLPVTSLVISGRNLIAGTLGGGVFLSSNNGTNWNEINDGLGNKEVVSLAVQGTKLFAGTTVGTVFLSENAGPRWSSVNNGLPNIETDFLPLAVSNTSLFVGCGVDAAGVYRTTNSGLSWTAVNDGLPYRALGSVMCLAAIDTSIFVGGYGVFLSKNNGTTWLADTSGLSFPGAGITSLAISDTNIFAGTNNYGVFHSTKNGTSWTAVNDSMPTMGYTIYCIAASGQNIFAGVSGSGVYLSTNNGANWTGVSPDLTWQNIFALVASDSDLFVGLRGGVGQVATLWRRPLSEMITGVSTENIHSPSHFALQQNYPNPFNPSTNILFVIPSESFVTLKVFDILGRKIATIVSEELSGGKHSKQWNAKGLPSGVYFYRLQAGSFTKTKKLVLLK